MPCSTKSRARGWWREHFHNHPGLVAKEPLAFVGTGNSAKAKVYCMKCFDRDIAFLQLKDQEDVTLGQIQIVQESTQIENDCKILVFYSQFLNKLLF
jgi:hypothetical protein